MDPTSESDGIKLKIENDNKDQNDVVCPITLDPISEIPVDEQIQIQLFNSKSNTSTHQVYSASALMEWVNESASFTNPTTRATLTPLEITKLLDQTKASQPRTCGTLEMVKKWMYNDEDPRYNTIAWVNKVEDPLVSADQQSPNSELYMMRVIQIIFKNMFNVFNDSGVPVHTIDVTFCFTMFVKVVWHRKMASSLLKVSQCAEFTDAIKQCRDNDFWNNEKWSTKVLDKFMCDHQLQLHEASRGYPEVSTYMACATSLLSLFCEEHIPSLLICVKNDIHCNYSDSLVDGIRHNLLIFIVFRQLCKNLNTDDLNTDDHNGVVFNNDDDDDDDRFVYMHVI